MTFKEKVYLDYAATTPVNPQVVEKMAPYFNRTFGNPSSVHTFGQEAEAALEEARETISDILNCKSKEIVFTSCGSESDNLALRGAAFAARETRGANHVLISPVEHHAVTHTSQQLADLHGFELEYLPVDKHGIIHPEDVAGCIKSDTAVVSVMYANNEIGSLNPVSEIGLICRDHQVAFHTDAVQAAAHLPIDLEQLNVDMLAIGAHKFYGPKGVGALYVKDGINLIPSQTGGGQEFGLRAGTSNIPYIVGMAEALRLVHANIEGRQAHYRSLRDRIISRVLSEIPESLLTGHPEQRLPNHASFVFRGVDGNALLMLLDVEGYACSSGSACKTGDPEPSDVLTSLGLSPEWALGSLRVTVGQDTQMDQIEAFLDTLPEAIAQVRKMQGTTDG